MWNNWSITTIWTTNKGDFYTLLFVLWFKWVSLGPRSINVRFSSVKNRMEVSERIKNGMLKKRMPRAELTTTTTICVSVCVREMWEQRKPIYYFPQENWKKKRVVKIVEKKIFFVLPAVSSLTQHVKIIWGESSFEWWPLWIADFNLTVNQSGSYCIRYDNNWSHRNRFIHKY